MRLYRTHEPVDPPPARTLDLRLEPHLIQRQRRLPEPDHLRDDERTHVRQRLRTFRKLMCGVLVRREQPVSLPRPVPVPIPVPAQRLSLRPPLPAPHVPLASLPPPERRDLARPPDLRVPPPLVLLHRPPDPANLHQLVPPLPRGALAPRAELVHGPLELVVRVPEDALRAPRGVAPAGARGGRHVGRGEARVERVRGRGEEEEARAVCAEEHGREAGEGALGEVFDPVCARK